MEKWGLALAGGGTRGAYHLGVWKAFLELGIEVSAVVGTSIGSVNGALFAQNDFEKCEKIWENIKLDNVIRFDSELMDEKNLLDYKNLYSLISEVVKKNGLETLPFKKMLSENIDEEKIRKSDILFGLNTTSVTDVESVGVFIDEIPEGELVDYIMASSAFPGFQRVMINNKVYADGGIMNNLPVDMLIKKGYKNIIAIDVGGLGIIRNDNALDVNLITIKCKKPLVGIFQFDSELFKKSIKQGYLDTYKAFGRLSGDNYYFNVGDYHNVKIKYSPEIIAGVESAAEIYGIDNLSVYKFDSLVEGVIKKFKLCARKYKNTGEIILENILNINKDPALILTRIVEIILENRTEGLNNKIFASVLSNKLLAAKAVAYFINNR